MNSAIVLILISVGANVNAEELLGEILFDRASDQVVGGFLADLDDSTMAKGAKAEVRTKTGAPKKGTFTPIQQPQQQAKRMFGGTNTKTNPNADMAIMKGKAAGLYKAQNDGRFSFGFERWGKDGGAERAVVKKPSGVFTPFNIPKAPEKRVFGGVNTKQNPKADMAKMKGAGMGLYKTSSKKR